eukprot:5569993-Lingulodinium_polyedra.AAC.1
MVAAGARARVFIVAPILLTTAAVATAARLDAIAAAERVAAAASPSGRFPLHRVAAPVSGFPAS